MLKAVIYTRVSTTRQAEEGTSLSEQLRQCLSKAEREDAEVVATYSDEGVSGALLLARPGIQSALADIESGKANCLITTRLDRTGRDVDIVREIQKRIAKAGGALLFADGMEFKNNPAGRLMLTQFAGFGEYEREMIRERTMLGAVNRVQSGKAMSVGARPFGYIIVTKFLVAKGDFPPEQEGKYYLHPEEAPLVKPLFEMFATGSSMRELARWLTERIKSRSDGAWFSGTIKQILSNPIYKGEAQWGRTTRTTDESRIEQGYSPYYHKREPRGEVYVLDAPVLVSEALWQRCQEKGQENKQKSGNPKSRKYLLSGLLRCPICGCSMVAFANSVKGGKKYAYYKCSKKNRIDGAKKGHCTFHKVLPVDKVDNEITEKFLMLVRDKDGDKAEKARQAAIKKAQESQEGSTKYLEKRTKELDREEAVAVHCQIKAEKGGQNTQYYEARVREIQEEKTELSQLLNRPAPPALRLPKPGFEDVARVLHDLTLGIDSRRKILGTWISKIRMDGDQYIFEAAFSPSKGTYKSLEDDPEYQAWLTLYSCLIATMNQ